MIIDCHVHVGETEWFHLHWDGDALVRLADRAGIDKMLVTDFTALMFNQDEGNALMRAVHQRHRDRIYPYFTVCSARYGRKVVEDLDRHVTDYGFRGLKIYSAGTYWKILDPWMYPIIEKAAELRIPILAHSTAEECEAVARMFPEVMIINAHSNGSPQGVGDWQRSIAAAKAFPNNIFLDTATSSFDNNMIETMVQEVGPQQILYGSDMPVLDPMLQIGKVQLAEIDEDAKEMILHRNISRLLSFRE